MATRVGHSGLSTSGTAAMHVSVREFATHVDIAQGTLSPRVVCSPGH